MNEHVTREEALAFLRRGVGNDKAEFREGQWEAIEGILRGRRQLVVQKTGWGKSIVYFLAAKFLRREGKGMTLLISPLLALMRNQVEAAEKLGVKVLTINSTNTDQWDAVTDEVTTTGADILLVSPERLANEEFKLRVLDRIADRIGLLVVDEAHCISDWGHDFRPDYRRISRILANLPPRAPVLATTATANARVCDDVRRQLGADVDVVRGSLVRESLYLQNIRFRCDEEKLAWLSETLKNRLAGSGIVYTLTTLEAERVARWLRREGIAAYAYFSSVKPPDDLNASLRADLDARLKPLGKKGAGDSAVSNAYREVLEKALLENRIRVLVATCALGMGFDKSDLKFVIHYQRPKSVVDYYQQVGRAGRGIASAYGVLLSDGRRGASEDDRIANYFISHAFPSRENIASILRAIKAAPNGVSKNELLERANIKKGALEQVLKFLMSVSPQPVILNERRYWATPAFEAYRFPFELVDHVTKLRQYELARMWDYVETRDCLMRFLCDELDSPMDGDCRCGNCASCDPARALPADYDRDKAMEAGVYLRGAHASLAPRKLWADLPSARDFGFAGANTRIPSDFMMSEGRVLASYNVGRWGRLVAKGKHRVTPASFDDALVSASAEMVREWRPDPAPMWVTAIPSRREPNLVADFACRLADRLGLPFHPCLARTEADLPPQREMENTIYQQRNALGAFRVAGECPVGHCLLVDDLVDSRWTLTVAAALLRRAGVASVTPLALADSMGKKDE